MTVAHVRVKKMTTKIRGDVGKTKVNVNYAFMNSTD